MNSTGCTWPSPHLRPSLTAAFHWSTQNWSASPNAASGPVSGETKPILIVAALAAAAAAAAAAGCVPQAASTPLRPPASAQRGAATPATLRKSRRVIGLAQRPRLVRSAFVRTHAASLSWSRGRPKLSHERAAAVGPPLWSLLASGHTRRPVTLPPPGAAGLSPLTIRHADGRSHDTGIILPGSTLSRTVRPIGTAVPYGPHPAASDQLGLTSSG